MSAGSKATVAVGQEALHVIRAVAYVRVSLEREDMISPQLQMKAVSEYCALRNYEIVRVIEDLDLSGRFWKTRQVDEAVAMLERGEAEVLVVWRWSRVSRNRLDWAMALDRVEAAGGSLESASEGFDTTTATGRFARGMLAEFAAFESDRMADIWREVRDRRIGLGLTPFGHEQFGYVKRNGGYVIDKRTGPVLNELYRRYAEGESFKSLSVWLARKRMRAPNALRTDTRLRGATLIRIMDNGFGAGLVSVGGEQYPGAHQPVISKEEWAAYLARREQTRITGHNTKQPVDSWLVSLVWCSCGRAMHLHTRGRMKPRYVCRWHGGRRQRCTRTINEDRLVGLIFQWLARLSSDAGHAAAARVESAHFARMSAERARQLVRDISTSGGDTPTTQQDLQDAEDDAAWRDPVEQARHLTEDWTTLADQRKREILVRLIQRLVVHTRGKVVTLTVHTHWQTASIIFSQDQTHQPCELPATGVRWLNQSEAIDLARINKATLRAWRDDGLLPLTRSDPAGHFLYALTDLQRVLATPRNGKLGVDHAALRRDLGQVPEVRFRPDQHPSARRLRELPDALVAELQQLRQRELDAFGVYRRRAAIIETGKLILAASVAGWHDTEIAICLRLSDQTLHKRVQSARLRAANGEPEAQVSAPSEPSRSTAFKQVPTSERDWLTIGEAARYAQRCTATIRHWRLAGLLPNTDETSSTARLYLRGDLQRVLDGPRQLHGADYRGLRDLITTQRSVRG